MESEREKAEKQIIALKDQVDMITIKLLDDQRKHTDQYAKLHNIRIAIEANIPATTPITQLDKDPHLTDTNVRVLKQKIEQYNEQHQKGLAKLYEELEAFTTNPVPTDTVKGPTTPTYAGVTPSDVDILVDVPLDMDAQQTQVKRRESDASQAMEESPAKRRIAAGSDAGTGNRQVSNSAQHAVS